MICWFEPMGSLSAWSANPFKRRHQLPLAPVSKGCTASRMIRNVLKSTTKQRLAPNSARHRTRSFASYLLPHTLCFHGHAFAQKSRYEQFMRTSGLAAASWVHRDLQATLVVEHPYVSCVAKIAHLLTQRCQQTTASALK